MLRECVTPIWRARYLTGSHFARSLGVQQVQDLFPESVLIADTSKQNYSTFPRTYYVDIMHTCKSCRRPFIFFAAEQKHWFEMLRLYVDADCIHCPECRQNRTTAKRELKRYAELINITNPSKAELQQLVYAANSLLMQGTLKNPSRLGQLKNRALKQIPDYAGTKALALILQPSPPTEKA